jgi:hypothetical protein
MIKKVLIAFCIGLMVMAGLDAKADTTATSGSNASAGANSGSEAVNAGNDQRITFEGSKQPSKVSVKNVPSMVAPGLTSSFNDVCAGSVSGSAGIMGFGGSAGKTYEFETCVRRMNAIFFANLGMKEVAKEIMCGDQEVYEAINAVAAQGDTGVRACMLLPSTGASGDLGGTRQVKRKTADEAKK